MVAQLRESIGGTRAVEHTGLQRKKEIDTRLPARLEQTAVILLLFLGASLPEFLQILSCVSVYKTHPYERGPMYFASSINRLCPKLIVSPSIVLDQYPASDSQTGGRKGRRENGRDSVSVMGF